MKLDAKDLILDIFAEVREFLHFIITSYEYFGSYIIFDKLKLILVQVSTNENLNIIHRNIRNHISSKAVEILCI